MKEIRLEDMSKRDMIIDRILQALDKTDIAVGIGLLELTKEILINKQMKEFKEEE